MRTPLQTDETVLLSTRTSWVVLVVPLLIAAGALAFGIWLNQLMWAALVILPALGYLGWKFLEWQHDIWVITNFRVIDEFGVFTINSKESPLDKINNVSYNQSVLGRVLNFGNVEIQTAATIGGTVYENVQAPKLLKDTITQAAGRYQHTRMHRQVKEVVQQMQPAPLQIDTAINSPSSSEIKYTNTSPFLYSLAGELEKLYELKQKGILTDEEYQRAKAKLLAL
jgi:uncharacterized membrane protein YdbT with pleckstrin-like domain